MDAKKYQTSAVSSPASHEEQGFFRKHRRGLKGVGFYAALTGVLYVGSVFSVGVVLVEGSKIYEHHNPRAVEQTVQQTEDKINKKYALYALVNKPAPYMMPILSAVEAPWRKMGYVMPEHYKQARAKAFEIAGIDEKNPLHDKKRFELYRQLGFAVLRTDDGSSGVYIPFSAWAGFIEQNSSFRNAEWGQLTEGGTSGGGKYVGNLMGKVFHKADSKAQGGNEDGVVDNLEWNRALRAAGYMTVDDTIEEIIETVKANGPGLRAELRQAVKKAQKSDKLVDLDAQLPLEIWESYLRMK